MNNIMVDNWFMEEVVADINDNKIHNSQNYADLLMAIVLWDEVYYPQNTHNWWKSFPSQVQNALQPIEDVAEQGYQSNLQGLRSMSAMPFISYLAQNAKICSDIISAAALHYVKLSSKNGCDYLPCKERQSLLLKFMTPQNIQKSLTRLKMQGNLDKSVEEYYHDTYKALLDFSDLKLKMPVLANFILDNTPNEMTPVEYAFHLKNEGAVIKYRQYLNQVEDALEKQNWKDLRFLLRCSNDAVSEVTSLDKKNLGSVKVRLLPTPSILLKYDGVSANISPTPSFEIKMKIQNPFGKIHLTFLKDLTKYAINDMKRW